MTPETWLRAMAKFISDNFTSMLIRAGVFRLGTIDTGYTSGAAKVLFDGETVPSGKEYKFLSSYSPAAGDGVLFFKLGQIELILGKVASSGSAPTTSTNWRYYMGVDHIG